MGKAVKTLLFLMTVLMITNLAFILVVHEQTHQIIGANHGCTEYSYGIDWTSAYYKCHEYQERTPAIANQEEILQNLAEIIHYGVAMLIFSGYTMIIFNKLGGHVL